MRKILLIFTLAAVFMMPGSALSQATVEWKGFQWNAYNAARIAVNIKGYLEVEPTNYNGGAAHHSTPNGFRSTKTPWIEATFLDDGQSSGIQLVMKNNYREYTEIGAWRSHKNYVIYWYDYQSRSNGLVDTSIARTPGEHTLRLGLQDNGTVDYWIDDVRVWSTNDINPESFEDVYLAAQISIGAFTDYHVGTDYSAPQSAQEISIDIKPEGYPNAINLKSKGVVPVTVMTTDEFDATSINPKTVDFAGAAGVRWTIEDVDSDGDLDLLVHFKTQELDLTAESTEATLRGETMEGQTIAGTDSVKIVAGSKHHAHKKRGGRL